MPLDELCSFARRECPRVMCIGAVMARPTHEIAADAVTLRTEAPGRTVVFVGGPAVLDLEPLSTPNLGYAATWERLFALMERVR